MTIHSWGAVAPAQSDVEKQAKNIRAYKPALNRWKTTKVLVIDEGQCLSCRPYRGRESNPDPVSMVDGHLFGMLSSIGRRLRKSPGRPFGGIQVRFDCPRTCSLN